MKSSILAVLLFVGFFSSRAAVMADPTPATMDEHFTVVLPADQPLAVAYVVDITSFDFKDPAQLEKFCMMAGERVAVFRGNFEEKKLFISPQPTMTEGTWTLEDWNTYFANRAAKLEAVYKSIIGS